MNASRMVAFVLSWQLVGVASASGPARVFDPARFQQLASVQTPARKFSWPSVQTFSARFESRAHAKPIGVVRGRLCWLKSGPKAMPLPSALTIDGFQWRGAVARDVALLVSWTKSEEFPHAMWLDRSGANYAVERCLVSLGSQKVLALAPGKTYGWSHDDCTLLFEAGATPCLEVSPHAWEDWIYTTTLLQSTEPVYTRVGGAEVPAAVRAAIAKGGKDAIPALHALADKPALPHDDIYDKASQLAISLGELKLARRLLSHFQPIGGCSMDRRPQEVARRYADVCFRLGDLGAFLQLYVQIIGDQFSRVAWSSMGDAAASTHASQLRMAGIDEGRFLIGLVLLFDLDEKKRTREISTRRIARAMHEANLDEQMDAILVRMAQDHNLDPYNRLRATQTLAFLRACRGDSTPSIEKLVRPTETLDLEPVSRHWLNRVLGHL